MGLDFGALRTGELKQLLKSRGVSVTDCFDRETLLERAEERRSCLEALSVPPPPAGWAGADPLEQGPEGGADAVLILLHGFGDSGDGFISQMGGPLIAQPGLRVVFPSAPRTQIGGFPVSSWLSLSPGVNPAQMMRAGGSEARSAVDYVHELIRREIARGVPSSAIAVGGFSQGGLVAVRAGLSFPDAPLGGVLALSTFFGAEAATVTAAQRSVRVQVCHGEADGVVPLAEGRRVAERVGRLAPDAAVSFCSYPSMAHATCPEEVRDIRAFLGALVEAEAPPEAADLKAMSAAELKAWLRGRGVPTADCFERADLVARALEV